MAMKTNKSYSKRLKVTKSGKVLARKTGQNHFNAKERSSGKAGKKGSSEFPMSNKDKSRFLVNIK
jgi:ribosomal protein L35